MTRISTATLKKLLLLLTSPFLLFNVAASKITFNACCVDEPLLKLYLLSLPECKYSCKVWNGCGNVIYNSRAKVCHLHSSTVTLNGTNCKGHALVSVINDGENPTVMEQGSWSFDSKNYCPELAVADENAIILGNMRVIGSKRKLTCKKPYEVYGQNIIICQPTGQWSSAGKCLQTCPTPTPTQDMFFVRIIREVEETSIDSNFDETETQFFQNSMITINCQSGSVLTGENSITCSDGQWTEFPTCMRPSIGSPCQDDSECVLANSRCGSFSKKCKCKNDFSYDSAANACVS